MAINAATKAFIAEPRKRICAPSKLGQHLIGLFAERGVSSHSLSANSLRLRRGGGQRCWLCFDRRKCLGLAGIHNHRHSSTFVFVIIVENRIDSVLLRSRTSFSDADEIAAGTVVSWAQIGHLQWRAKLCFRCSFFDARDYSSLHRWGWRRVSRWRRTCAHQQGDERSEQSSGAHFDEGDFFRTICHRDQSTKTTDSRPGGVEARLPRRKSVPFWRDRRRGVRMEI
jgi:hypothetical protein